MAREEINMVCGGKDGKLRWSVAGGMDWRNGVVDQSGPTTRVGETPGQLARTRLGA